MERESSSASKFAKFQIVDRKTGQRFYALVSNKGIVAFKTPLEQRDDLACLDFNSGIARRDGELW
jgi:hypothetical protein